MVSNENAEKNNPNLYFGDDEPSKPVTSGNVVAWEASEFVVHSRPSWWHVAFVAVSLIVAGLVYLLLRDLFASVVMVVVFGLSYVMAVRKPRTLSYVIDDEGVTIGQKLHPYEMFHSFSVVQEGGLQSIQLNPLQRFSLPIVVYFAPDDGQKIVEQLTYHLPHEELEMSAIDKLSRNLRF